MRADDEGSDGGACQEEEEEEAREREMEASHEASEAHEEDGRFSRAKKTEPRISFFCACEECENKYKPQVAR